VDHSIGNFVPFSFNYVFLLFVYFDVLICFVLLCMSVLVINSKGRLETSETFFGSLFDTPTSSPTSSIMAEERERVVLPKAPRRTMYELLHPTQSSIPSCIMFPPNAPHVKIKQGLLAILPDFRGLKNENPYVHVRAFEEVIGSFYAQNVIETAKLRFFPFSLKDKAKGCLYTLKPRKLGGDDPRVLQEILPFLQSPTSKEEDL
jgi:hypothetical protein